MPPQPANIRQNAAANSHKWLILMGILAFITVYLFRYKNYELKISELILSRGDCWLGDYDVR